MRRLFAAAVLVAAVASVSCSTAFAQTPAGGEHFLLFSGADGWASGGFGHGGMVWSPDGLNRDGLAVKLLGGAGTYRYQSNGSEITGTQFVAAAMPGWRFKQGSFEATLFAGLDFQDHRLNPADPANRLQGAHLGLRTGADLWWQPTPETMTSFSASYSTVGASYFTRGALGLRVFDSVYLGPEITALGSDNYHQFRFGAHATALKTGAWEWSSGLGWADDSSRRSGLYARIGVLTRR